MCAWTYTPNFTLARDRIRVLVGDTDPADPLVQDEEIALYTTGGTFAQSSDAAAAVEVCRAIVAKLARRVTMSAGVSSVNLGEQVAHYRDLLTDLIRQSSSTSAVPYAGGISRADVLAREADTDRVAPFFDRRTGEPGAPARTTRWWP
jgi:hypothetical protein